MDVSISSLATASAPIKAGVSIDWVAQGSNQAGIITLDAATSQRHTLDSEITEHPVEKGANPVDHTRPRPAALSIEAVVTDYPVSIRGGGIGVPHQDGRAAGIFEKLDSLRLSGTPVRVTTKLRVYSNMLIKTVDCPVDKTLKGALKLSLTFMEVRIVESQSVPVQKASSNQGQPKIKDGHQNTKAASDAVKEKSALRSITQGELPAMLKTMSKLVVGG